MSKRRLRSEGHGMVDDIECRGMHGQQAPSCPIEGSMEAESRCMEGLSIGVSR
jgi:hypothetical protein